MSRGLGYHGLGIRGYEYESTNYVGGEIFLWMRRRFLTACKVLGRERLATLTIHHGRHTFISHALAGGRSLAEVKQAAGHSNLITTSVYLHIAVDDDSVVGRLFAG